MLYNKFKYFTVTATSLVKANNKNDAQKLAMGRRGLNGEITISANPVFICGINRKINIGNFENINLYVSQTTQNVCASEEASQRYQLISEEASQRYQLIKQAQNNH